MSDVIDAALRLAAEGTPVFPVRGNKRPATPHGFKDATCNPAAVRELFTLYRAPLIGVATGSVSNIDALDIDPRHDGDAWLRSNAERLPQTRTHRTRSGGLHLLFQHAPGVRNSTNKIGPGVDVRADGGCLIWWPAARFPIVCDAPIAPWPRWLLYELQTPPVRSPTKGPFSLPGGSDDARRYAIGALRDAVRKVAAAPEGTRNATLNRETFAIARFVASGLLSVNWITEALTVAAHAAGLSP